MDKRMNYLAAIPIYGSIILMVWLFIKTIKQEIGMKQLGAYMASSALVGFLSILFAVLFVKFIGSIFENATFISDYGLIIGFILGGYLMNIFTFTMVNKNL